MDDSTISINPQRKYPWQWTSQEVVLYLSRRPSLREHFESETLRSAFTDNVITGSALLDTEFTPQTLNEDLGIPQAGIRIEIWRVIRALRKAYPARSDLDLHDDELLLSPVEAPTSDEALAVIEQHTPGADILTLPETTVIRFGPFDAEQLPSITQQTSRFFSTPGPSTLVTRPHSILQVEDADQSGSLGRGSSLSVGADHVSFDLPTPETPTPSREPSDEDEIQRGDNPAPPTTSIFQDAEDDAGNFGSTGMELSVTNSGIVEAVGDNSCETVYGDDRVADPSEEEEDLVLSAKNSLITPQLSPKLPPGELSLERSNKRVRSPLSPDQVPLKRRRKAGPSAYLGNRVTIGESMLIGGTVSSDTSKTFVILGGKARQRAQVTPGAIRSVNAWFKAFLRRRIETAVLNGKEHRAFPLYTIRHVQRFTRHPITVINKDEVKDGEDIKNHIENFPGLDVSKYFYRKRSDRATFLDPTTEGRRDIQYVDPYMRLDGEDALLTLQTHYLNQEDSNRAIPVHYRRGRSPGLDSKTLTEMRRDRIEAATKKEHNLTIEQISQVFEETREAILEKWRETHLPALQEKKYKLWTESRKGKYDQDAKKNARESIGRCKVIIKENEAQIEAQKKEYLDSKWPSVAKLRQMIKAGSKVSLESLEEHRWKVEAIRGKRPERPPPKPIRPPDLTVPQSFDEEPDSLWNEQSEVEDSDGVENWDGDDLDGFVVPDDVLEEGHEALQAANDAFLAEYGDRFQLAAADEEIEDAPDSQLDGEMVDLEPLLSGLLEEEDIILPDAEAPQIPLPDIEDPSPAVLAKEKTPVVEKEAVEKEKEMPKKSSDQFQWFSNFSQSSPLPAPVDSMPPDAEPVSENPFTLEFESNTPTAPVAPVPSIIDNSEPTAAASSAFSPPQQVKKEHSPLIHTSWDRTDIIDLTEDTPNPSPVSPTVSGPSRAKPVEQIDLLELETDMETQRAIENSLLENNPSSSSQRQISQTPSQSSYTSRVPKRRPVIHNDKSKPSPWKQALQNLYDSKPKVMVPMLEIARGTNRTASSLPLEQRIIKFIDRLKGKEDATKTLGLTPEELNAHRSIANLYYKWSYPSGNAQNMDREARKSLAKALNLNRFIRELTPILENVVAWEESKHQSGPDAAQSPAPSNTTEQRSLIIQEPLIVDDIDQPIQANAQTTSNEKGKGKQRVVVLDPESDYDLDTQNFSQTSARFSSPVASQASKPRQMVHRKELTEKEETLILREKKRKENKNRRGRELAQTKMGLHKELVNLGHYAKQPPVPFPTNVGNEALHQFQKDGIQAMWREVVSSDLRSGVLLAHTMGMGKTIQVLTLLGTISDSAQSKNSEIVKQIPDHLKNMRALIVAPPGLLENWAEEIDKWKIKSLNPVYMIGSKYEPYERAEIIRQWAKNGTLLLIGYEIFRSFFADHPDYRPLFPSLKSKELILTATSDIPDLLLQTPTIVVADEAHRLKNSSSVLARIFRKFATRSRIAMTGSPLTNNLSEYYNIVKWIDETYAGTETYFNGTFKNPIEDGLYAESLPEEISKSKVMQRVLIKLWKDKIHRVNIANLQDIQRTLPPKTEFVITLPLSDVQYDIYKVYAEKVKRNILGKTQNFLSFIQELSTLLNHPQIFWDEMVSKVEKKNKGAREPVETGATGSLDDALSAGEAADNDFAEPGPSTTEGKITAASEKKAAEKLIGQEQASIYDEVKAILGRKPCLNLSDPVHSFRIIALIRIIDACIAIKEKLLVFSQSVKTLEYLAKILKKRKTAYNMLHGGIGTGKRQGITKQFSDSDTCVFLISTRAGGLGLNIQSASRIVIFDCLFSPQDEEQAVGRAYRLGQTKHVFVYRFQIGGTYEDIIYNQSLLKLSLALRMLDRKEPRRAAQKKKASDWFNPPKKLDGVRKDLASFKGKDAKVLDDLLGEDWVRDLQTHDTYELHKDDPFTADEEEQYEAMVKEEEMRRLLGRGVGSSDVGVPPPGSARKSGVPGSSTADGSGEVTKERKRRKKKDATIFTPTQQKSIEQTEQVGNPALAQSSLTTDSYLPSSSRQFGAIPAVGPALNQIPRSGQLLGEIAPSPNSGARSATNAPSPAINRLPALKLRGAGPVNDFFKQ
ncbi:hypothetical protein AA313_de0200254 [Arthrobotrys entomopaga]|nr:hypothetical protein AA313_de0200254 [Arthrobotrys entomopaga]